MGLPSSRLQGPLFAPTPTEGGFAQFGTPNTSQLLGQAQPQPIPFPSLAALAPQAIPRLTDQEIAAIRKRAMDRKPVSIGMGGQYGGGLF
jgi:hypothetical protein